MATFGADAVQAGVRVNASRADAQRLRAQSFAVTRVAQTLEDPRATILVVVSGHSSWIATQSCIRDRDSADDRAHASATGRGANGDCALLGRSSVAWRRRRPGPHERVRGASARTGLRCALAPGVAARGRALRSIRKVVSRSTAPLSSLSARAHGDLIMARGTHCYSRASFPNQSLAFRG